MSKENEWIHMVHPDLPGRAPVRANLAAFETVWSPKGWVEYTLPEPVSEPEEQWEDWEDEEIFSDDPEGEFDEGEK